MTVAHWVDYSAAWTADYLVVSLAEPTVARLVAPTAEQKAAQRVVN